MCMKRTERWLTDTGKQERNNEKELNRVKLIGTKEEIEMLVRMHEKMAENGDIEIVDRSEILDSKGEAKKRQFLEIRVLNTEE